MTNRHRPHCHQNARYSAGIPRGSIPRRIKSIVLSQDRLRINWRSFTSSSRLQWSVQAHTVSYIHGTVWYRPSNTLHFPCNASFRLRTVLKGRALSQTGSYCPEQALYGPIQALHWFAHALYCSHTQRGGKNRPCPGHTSYAEASPLAIGFSTPSYHDSGNRVLAGLAFTTSQYLGELPPHT